MRSQRLIAAAVVIALSGALAGCSSGLSNWDPTDLLDFLDTKKKLPGQRKPVFPDGVPGLEQGVPKELYKGAAQQPDAPAVAAVQPDEPKPQKSAKKGKGKQPASATPAPDAAQAPAPDGEAAPEEEGSTAAAPPAPKPKKIVRRRTTAPPPDATAPQAAQPAQPQQSASPFPAPVPAGTFQR